MKTYIEFRNSLFTDVLPFIDRTTNLLKAKNYLTWNSIVEPQHRNLLLAKEYGVKSVVYNHGLFGHEDHCPWIADLYTGVTGKPMIADKYLCWGHRDYNDLIKAGISKDRLAIVGYTGMWESIFDYKLSNGKTYRTSYNAGYKIEDPVTHETGILVGRDHQIRKQHPKPKWITYLPSHDVLERHMVHTRENYKILKDYPDLIIKASSQYVGLEEKNPFKDIKNYNYCGKCDKITISPDDKNGRCPICGDETPLMPAVTYTATNSADNLPKLRSLISESKVVIQDYCGTPNVLCWAIGVPLITIKNDYGLREMVDGKPVVTHHECAADILCEPKDLLQTIEDVCSGKIDKRKEMAEAAEEFAGVSFGWPTMNILKELEA